MIIIVNKKPFPICRHCKKPMAYRVPGMADKDHAHSACDAAYYTAAILKLCKEEEEK